MEIFFSRFKSVIYTLFKSACSLLVPLELFWAVCVFLLWGPV